jgi:hypothetical protein
MKPRRRTGVANTMPPASSPAKPEVETNERFRSVKKREEAPRKSGVLRKARQAAAQD